MDSPDDYNSLFEMIRELRGDLKEIKVSLVALTSMEQVQIYHRESIDRAFTKMKELEVRLDTHNDILNQFHGMKSLAIALWTVLASGLGVVILKVFSISGAL